MSSSRTVKKCQFSWYWCYLYCFEFKILQSLKIAESIDPSEICSLPQRLSSLEEALARGLLHPSVSAKASVQIEEDAHFSTTTPWRCKISVFKETLVYESWKHYNK